MTSIANVSVARATLGGAFARAPGRLALATIAIGLGIALGFAIALVNRTAISEFNASMATLSGMADLEVRGPRAGFDEQLFATIARIDGVSIASPVVEIDARIPGRDDNLRIVGVDAMRAAGVTPALVGVTDDSIDLLDPDAVFLSPVAARDVGLRAGDTLNVQVGTSQIALRVAGLTRGGERARFAVMDIAGAQAHFGRAGRLSRIDLRIEPGVDAGTARTRIDAVLPPGVAVMPPGEGADATLRFSRAYRINLNVLALVALFTGGLLVFSTQTLAVTQRRAQFALLRTLGLRRTRLLYLVIVEGALVGLAGAALGLPAGYVLARFALQQFGGDLGAGFFRGVAPDVDIDPAAALLFALLGIVAAVAGSYLPAREAARAAPAPALKAGGGDLAFVSRTRAWPGLAVLVAGALAALGPPVGDLPIFGYVSIALLVIGTLMLLPVTTASILALAPRPRHVASALAFDQLRNAPGQATVSLAAIVASVALMASMAIMVASFRQSLDDWLQQVLPADVYVRPGLTSDSAYLSPDDQQRIASDPNVSRVEFSRLQSVLLDPALPRVSVIARNLDDPSRRLPLIGPPADSDGTKLPRAWVTEAAADLYRLTPGQRIELPLAGRNVSFVVGGVWRDYVRQQGAILIDRATYVGATGDRDANDAAVWLRPGASVAQFSRSIETTLGGADRVAIATAGELREISLRIFDRTFAVTYALEAAAVVIGLAGLASSFGALALARRREFGMLRHLGMTRGQIAGMLTAEGLAVSTIGLVTGGFLGGVMSLVLVHVVNRQSFHWSMDMHVPWIGLASFGLALLALSLVTTRVAAREAMSANAVRVVKDDW